MTTESTLENGLNACSVGSLHFWVPQPSASNFEGGHAAAEVWRMIRSVP